MVARSISVLSHVSVTFLLRHYSHLALFRHPSYKPESSLHFFEIKSLRINSKCFRLRSLGVSLLFSFLRKCKLRNETCPYFERFSGITILDQGSLLVSNYYAIVLCLVPFRKPI